MIKKILISLLFFALYNSYIIAMDVESDKTIDYDHFFELCKNGQKSVIKNFIKENPTIDINYQNNQGTTPLLYATTWFSWKNVWYLLKHCNANKMMKDNYEQTIFSIAVYNSSSYSFKKLLKIYSFNEINELCKTICLPIKMDNSAEFYRFINTIILEALNKKKDLNEKQDGGKTVLHKACIYKKIPLIIELLKHGADLDIKNDSGKSCYDCLYTEKTSNNRAPFFVVREAFNNGLVIPAALIQNVFENIGHDIDCDVSHYIKQLYVDLIVQDKLSELPKARIWKYICEDACEKGGLIKQNEKADEKRCLAIIMLLPQKKLTEINIQLALGDK